MNNPAQARATGFDLSMLALVFVASYIVVSAMALQYLHAVYFRESGVAAAGFCTGFVWRVARHFGFATPSFSRIDIVASAAMLLCAYLLARFVFGGSYVLPNYDALIVPHLANEFEQGHRQSDIAALQEVLQLYPPGYALVLALARYAVDAMALLHVFKHVNLVLLALLPVTWALFMRQMFFPRRPLWWIVLAAYLAFVGLERTLVFGAAGGKYASLFAQALIPLVLYVLCAPGSGWLRVVVGGLGIAALTLVHYQTPYIVALALAGLLLAFPRRFAQGRVLAVWGLAGLLGVALALAAMPEILRAPNLLGGASGGCRDFAQFVDSVFEKHSKFWSIYNDAPFGFEWSLWRGYVLVGCVAALFVAGRLSRRVEPLEEQDHFSALAMFCLVTLASSVLLASQCLPLGITQDYVRWFAWLFQALLFTGVLLALARLVGRRSVPAYLLAACLVVVTIAGVRWAMLDAAAVRVAVRTYSYQRDDLVKLDALLQGGRTRGACAVVAVSATAGAGQAYLKSAHKAWGVSEYHYVHPNHWTPDFIDIATSCRMVSGSYLKRSVPGGRDLAGLPKPDLLFDLMQQGNAVYYAGDSAGLAAYDAQLAQAGIQARWLAEGTVTGTAFWRLSELGRATQP